MGDNQKVFGVVLTPYKDAAEGTAALWQWSGRAAGVEINLFRFDRTNAWSLYVTSDCRRREGVTFRVYDQVSIADAERAWLNSAHEQTPWLAAKVTDLLAPIDVDMVEHDSGAEVAP